MFKITNLFQNKEQINVKCFGGTGTVKDGPELEQLLTMTFYGCFATCYGESQYLKKIVFRDL